MATLKIENFKYMGSSTGTEFNTVNTKAKISTKRCELNFFLKTIREITFFDDSNFNATALHGTQVAVPRSLLVRLKKSAGSKLSVVGSDPGG
jgi:hypothetical protein